MDIYALVTRVQYLGSPEHLVGKEFAYRGVRHRVETVDASTGRALLRSPDGIAVPFPLETLVVARLRETTPLAEEVESL
jgi:hypothetical protein